MILIIGAMQEEVNALKKHLQNPKDSFTHDIPIVAGTIYDTSVVVAQSGVGKVNAAFTTTILIQTFNPDLVINIGSAGGLLPNQNVGDVVIANALQYHDLDIGPDTKDDERFFFETDHAAVNCIKGVIKNIGIPYHIGKIVSGDQFVTNTSDAFKTIQTHFSEAICVEMEAAAIAHVCSRLNKPFIVLRSLSDITHQTGNAITFEEYLHLASENSAAICVQFIQAYYA